MLCKKMKSYPFHLLISHKSRVSSCILHFCFSSIKQSLKVLQLSIPTTKADIKKQFLVLAKKYHPDSADESKSQTESKAKKQNNRILQQKFVQINQAYQYLKPLTETQINQNKDRRQEPSSSSSSSSASSPESGPFRRRMSTEQQKRRQTYEYFNRKFQQQFATANSSTSTNANRSVNGSQLGSNYQSKPLYKSVPEIFVGFLLLAFGLGDWAYRVWKRDQQGEQKGKQKGKNKLGDFDDEQWEQKEEKARRNPYRNFNYNNAARRIAMENQ